MLLTSIFILAGIVGTAATYALCDGLSLWWVLLMIPAYYLAAVIVYVIWLFTTILLTPQTDTPSKKLKNFYHWCEVHTMNWVLTLLGVRYRLDGEENIPTDRPYLLVCNHRSAFDPMTTVATFKKWQLCFVCKPEIFQVPIFGTAMKRAGFFPIDRDNPRNAVTAIKHAAQVITEQGRSVGIYPEGTRTTGEGDMLPFHAGSFKIAKMADCPVVVASVRVTNGLMYPRRVELNVLDVMEEDFVRENNTATLAERAQTTIREDLGI